jgi:Fe-S-cluster-containing dehydrogenase component
MNSNRRDFLKIMAVGAAGAATALAAGPAQARPPKALPPGAVGLLYDATLCIGCKACEVGCKAANQMPMDHDSGVEQAHGVRGVWDAPDDLNSRTLNKIKLCATGDPGDPNQGGFSFVKRACMHCVDPNCVSACPVSALTKDPVTGIVRYDADACIGCRYCQLACPFNVPKFEYDKPFPKIVKCQLCSERIAQGALPACAAACPTGACLFGPVTGLLAEGHRRLGFQPGETQDYPIHSLENREHRAAKVTGYVPGIYGETETGGTQQLLMAGVPFDQLGLPPLGEDSRARLSETMQHTLYQGMFAPTLLFGGLVYAVFRSTRDGCADHSNPAEPTDPASAPEERRHE